MPLGDRPPAHFQEEACRGTGQFLGVREVVDFWSLEHVNGECRVWGEDVLLQRVYDGRLWLG